MRLCHLHMKCLSFTILSHTIALAHSAETSQTDTAVDASSWKGLARNVRDIRHRQTVKNTQLLSTPNLMES